MLEMCFYAFRIFGFLRAIRDYLNIDRVVGMDLYGLAIRGGNDKCYSLTPFEAKCFENWIIGLM